MDYSSMRERIADSQERQAAWGTEGGFQGFFHNGQQIASPDEIMATSNEEELNSLLSSNMASNNQNTGDLESLLAELLGQGITRQGGNY